MGGRIYGLCRDIEPSGESRPDREGRYWDRGETFTERAKTVHGSVSVENGFSTSAVTIRCSVSETRPCWSGLRPLTGASRSKIGFLPGQSRYGTVSETRPCLERAKTAHGSVSVENGFSTGAVAVR